MKVLIISNNDTTGGAAIAAQRIAKSLIGKGIYAKMLVQKKNSDKEFVFTTTHSKYKKLLNFYRFAFERFVFFIVEKSKEVRFSFSMANTGEDISKHKLVKNADIIHIHWVNQGFISLKGISKILELNKPVIWTFHDMWPMTGGCHHSYSCDNFTDHCGNCFYIKKSRNYDLSFKVLSKKKKLFNLKNLSIVTVSNWLGQRTSQSSLFLNAPIHVIHNPIDTSIFRPVNKTEARQKLGISLDKKYILFGAMRIDDPIKGWDMFVKALELLCSNGGFKENTEILAFGRIKDDTKVFNTCPLKINHFGTVSNTERLNYIYNSANLSVVSSYYETFSQVASESFCCGVPVVAFNNSGPKDIIDHKINGYLSQYKSIEDLASGINWLINEADSPTVSLKAREKVMNTFTEDIVAEKYINLYTSLLQNK